MNTLEEYFFDNFKNNTIDYSLRVDVTPEGMVKFYIHPAYVSGDTLDFVVLPGDILANITTIHKEHIS